MSAVTKKQEERRARLWASVQGREVDESVGFRSILVMEIIFLEVSNKFHCIFIVFSLFSNVKSIQFELHFNKI
jgi:hypothetical protein